MLSSILSRIFRLGFILVVIVGLAAIVGQALQKTIRIPIGKGTITFSKPGLRVDASRNNSFERLAPDTTIRYSFTDSNDRPTHSGVISLRGDDDLHNREKLLQLIAERKASNERLEIDTTITFMGQAHYDEKMNADATRRHPVKVDTVFVASLNDESAMNINAALQKGLIEEYWPSNRISQESNPSQELNIMPSGGWQHFGFVVYDLIRYFGLAVLFLGLARLFRNFSQRFFFTRSNVILLKNIGWALLIPCVAAGLLYWLFLVDIHPVLLEFGNQFKQRAFINFDINPGINWTLLILGASLLVLAHIFNNALTIKEENAFII